MVSEDSQSQGLSRNSRSKVTPPNRGILPLAPSVVRSLLRCSGAAGQRGHFQSECPRRGRSELSTGPCLQAGSAVDSKVIRGTHTVEAEKSIMPSVRSGVFGYGESKWKIPLKVNGVLMSDVVDTVADITITQMVYDSMPPHLDIIASKDVLVEIRGTQVKHRGVNSL